MAAELGEARFQCAQRNCYLTYSLKQIPASRNGWLDPRERVAREFGPLVTRFVALFLSACPDARPWAANTGRPLPLTLQKRRLDSPPLDCETAILTVTKSREMIQSQRSASQSELARRRACEAAVTCRYRSCLGKRRSPAQSCTGNTAAKEIVSADLVP